MTLPPPPGSVPPPPDPGFPAAPSGMVVVEARPISVAAMVSLICGILFCIPFLAGALAVLLGIVGIFQTGETKKRGRWMAVAGLLLGIASIGASVVGTTVFGLYLYGRSHTDTKDAAGAIASTNDFLRAVSDGNTEVMEKHNGGLPPVALKSVCDYCKSQGSFISTDVNASVSNDSAELSGTAQYTLRSQTLKVSLTYADGTWKITYIEIRPIVSPADGGGPPAPIPAPGGGENSLPEHGPGGGVNENMPTPTPVPAPAPAPAPTPALVPPVVQQPLTNGAVVATQEFIRGLCEGDDNLVSRHNGGFSRETVQSFTDYFKPLGKLTGTHFTGETGPETTTVSGTAVFENSKQTVKADLVLKDGEWKVVKIDVNPVAK